MLTLIYFQSLSGNELSGRLQASTGNDLKNNNNFKTQKQVLAPCSLNFRVGMLLLYKKRW